MVLFLDELHVARSLRRVIRSGRFSVTLDAAFPDVMRRLRRAAAGAGRHLDHDGDARRVRAAGHDSAMPTRWKRGTDDELVGGLYGVAIGRMFFGESMFARQTDASKVALVHLVRQLRRWDFELIDCQMSTSHLASLGAREIPRVAVRQRRSVAWSRQPPTPSDRWRIERRPRGKPLSTIEDAADDGDPTGRA